MTERPQTPATPDPDPVDVAREWLPRMTPPGQGMLGRLIAALEYERHLAKLLRLRIEDLEWQWEHRVSHHLLPPSALAAAAHVRVEVEVDSDEGDRCWSCHRQLNGHPGNWVECLATDPLDALVDEAAARRAGG
jgi:hypothetical protein